jgi:hypothetical protein
MGLLFATEELTSSSVSQSSQENLPAPSHKRKNCDRRIELKMGNALVVAWSGQKRGRLLARSIVVAAVFLFIFKRAAASLLAFTTTTQRV